MKRKGISPILASVLLLAVTLAVAGVFSGWAPDIAKDITSSTGESARDRLSCDKGSIDIVSAAYDISGNNNLTVLLRNKGDIDLENVTVAEFSENDVIGEKKTVNVPKGNLTDTNLSSVADKPAYVKAFSQKCGSVTDRLEDISQ